MITAYFLISAFVMGWLFGADHATKGQQWTPWERVATAALCIAWPFLLFIIWKTWRDSK